MHNNHHKLILIVDDSVDIREPLQQILEGEGFQIAVAVNGKEGLDYLQSTKRLPDLILLDLMMPDMDGFQFRKAQENIPLVGSIPILLMSADANIQYKAIKMGVKGILPKPFQDIDTLIATIEKYL
jgi:two-component system response regulator MprA